MSITYDEYKEICAVLRNYARYEMLYKKYFCTVATNSQTGEQTLIFSDELAERNANFIEKWQPKKQKIEARLKKDSYFKQAGKNRDEKDLRLGNRKFADLTQYYKLESEFDKLEDMLLKMQPRQTLEEHITDLRKKKANFEASLSSGGQTPQPQI